jgi:hypothetical protein
MKSMMMDLIGFVVEFRDERVDGKQSTVMEAWVLF